ncbi:MAG: malto-oligosyltrehalose synthase [Cyanophyceae cyanobacterium]
MRIPTATYRLQFHSGFNFEAAKNVVSYLAELGISDLYASPIFKAKAGSTHGYDVVDPTELNPELGSQKTFDELNSKLQHHDMGWLQDIVPNHMAYNSQNKFLMDVLEHGTDSEYFDFFDIAWNQPYEDMQGRVLTPLLGNFYGESLENGEIQLSYDQDGLSVNYYDLKLPLKIETYAQFMTYNLGKLSKTLGREHTDFIKLLGILYLTKNIPTETKGKERKDQATFVKGILWELYEQNEAVKDFINDNLETFNGRSGNPESFNLLDSLLSEQFYRLSFWKVGAEELNYRRFFTVNELISVKVEEARVFNVTHALIEKLVEDGKITGLRIDHIDGLYDPTRYLERLRNKVGNTYVTVEKILELEEELPRYWSVQGTSGYDFLNYVNGVLCQIENEAEFDRIYQQFTGITTPYEELVIQKKALIEERNLAGDVDNLSILLKKIASQTREGKDFTQYGLKRALVEVLTLFPIYRTYITAQRVMQSDKQYISEAIARAKERDPLLVKELSYIEKILLREFEETLSEPQKQEQLHFVMRLQQMTGPLMAKGVEDTLFYVYNRLISLNEVGGNPGQLGVTLAEFHEFNQFRNKYWQQSMSTTATHDTKRGEDGRSRLNVLSEIPEAWQQQLQHWREINQTQKIKRGKKLIPSANDEYFFYQTLIGSFPFEQDQFESFVGRLKDYIIKAVREAKVHTAWLRPDSEYEDGFLQFIDAVLNSESHQFLSEFLPFQNKIASYGVFNSLSQVLLKYASPGVPDLYQGTELWDLSMVDPDNRRPVDYDQRQSFLKEIQQNIGSNILHLVYELLKAPEDGRVKLFLTYQILQTRKAYLNVFQRGGYEPLATQGQYAEHIIAFARSYEKRTIVAVVPRFFTNIIQPGELPVGDLWQDTQIGLPPYMSSVWKNAITSQSIKTNGILSISEALQHFPLALLVSEE